MFDREKQVLELRVERSVRMIFAPTKLKEQEGPDPSIFQDDRHRSNSLFSLELTGWKVGFLGKEQLL